MATQSQATKSLAKKKHVEIRLAGFGGQGVMLAGMVLGHAAAVNEKRHAVMAQSYGPESRGGASSAEVLIDNEEIHFPHAVDLDVAVILSQEAYVKFGKTRGKDTILIAENLVELDPAAEKGKPPALLCPFTAIAEKVGRRLVLNMVALGFICRVTSIVSVDAMKKSIAVSVPPGTEELNLRAFEAGFAYTEGLSA